MNVRNKLVIIGNGFDLAHGLNTSYCHFMDYYLDKIISDSNKHPFFSRTFNGKDERVRIINRDEAYKSSSVLMEELIKHLAPKNEVRWVDIEAIYFKILISFLNQYKNDNSTLTQFSKLDSNHYLEIFKNHVQKLNSDFEVVKRDMKEYLLKIKFTKSNKNDNLLAIINNDLASKRVSDSIQTKTLFLNFNYTNTLGLYAEILDPNYNEIIEIHGNLRDKNNPVIFGYGDEMNPYHKEIMDLNINELFVHFKSFQYAETENYQKFLLFLQTPFDVYILGHSCGLSDRVLFSTIFNKVECKCIYPFYYINENGKDDFTEKTFELSRHFNSTEEFRTKIQSKTKCQTI